MSTEETCLNCSIATRKYKCSKCLQFCCSLPCYKSHQDDGKCVRPASPSSSGQAVELITIDPLPEESQRLQMFTTDDTVDAGKLSELAQSERLKDLLRNPHLRDYLRQLDTTPDAWKAMKVAMLEPLFVEFANECLAVVEPDTEAPQQVQLTESEQMVSAFCAAVIRNVDGTK